MAGVRSIGDWVKVVVDQDLSSAARSRATADYARAEFQKAQETNRQALGRAPAHQSFVDGRKGAPLETVKPQGGVILFEFDLIADMLRWIDRTLRERSPEISGRFKRGWKLLADGQEVDVNAPIPAAETYIFLNTEPYARKLELGRTKSGRAFVVQVPPRFAERTARDASRRFGNQAKVAFGYQSLQSGGSVSKWARSASGRAWARKRSERREALHHEWLTRQPAIFIYPR